MCPNFLDQTPKEVYRSTEVFKLDWADLVYTDINKR